MAVISECDDIAVARQSAPECYLARRARFGAKEFHRLAGHGLAEGHIAIKSVEDVSESLDDDAPEYAYGLKIKSAPAASFDAPVNGLRFHTTNAAGFSEAITKEAKISGPPPSKMGVREGDVLVLTRLDRLARLIADLVDIEGRLKRKKAVLSILDPALDTSSSSGRLMFNIFGSVAQFEREIMLER